MSTTRPGAHRLAVSYIDKSREYYEAQGYDQAYRWATNDDAPFTPLAKPLARCRVGVVTTAYPHRDHEAAADDGPTLVETKEPYAASAVPPPEAMYTADLSWDKGATHTDDVETFLPLRALASFAEQGRIGSVSPRFYGVPTEYSRRRTEADAETIRSWIAADEVDVVVLVPL